MRIGGLRVHGPSLHEHLEDCIIWLADVPGNLLRCSVQRDGSLSLGIHG